MALSYPHTSAYIQAEEAQDFERLLTIVWPIAEAQYPKVSANLNMAINALFESDPDLLEELRRVPFGSSIRTKSSRI